MEPKRTIMQDMPKWLLGMINNLYEIECRLRRYGDDGNALRNVEKSKDLLEAQGFFYEDPMGQAFTETRSDLEASIVGSNLDGLVVVEVLKPIIRTGTREYSVVVQKGIVVVESKSGE